MWVADAEVCVVPTLFANDERVETHLSFYEEIPLFGKAYVICLRAHCIDVIDVSPDVARSSRQLRLELPVEICLDERLVDIHNDTVDHAVSLTTFHLQIYFCTESALCCLELKFKQPAGGAQITTSVAWSAVYELFSLSQFDAPLRRGWSVCTLEPGSVLLSTVNNLWLVTTDQTHLVCDSVLHGEDGYEAHKVDLVSFVMAFARELIVREPERRSFFAQAKKALRSVIQGAVQHNAVEPHWSHLKAVRVSDGSFSAVVFYSCLSTEGKSELTDCEEYLLVVGHYGSAVDCRVVFKMDFSRSRASEVVTENTTEGEQTLPSEGKPPCKKRRSYAMREHSDPLQSDLIWLAERLLISGNFSLLCLYHPVQRSFYLMQSASRVSSLLSALLASQPNLAQTGLEEVVVESSFLPLGENLLALQLGAQELWIHYKEAYVAPSLVRVSLSQFASENAQDLPSLSAEEALPCSTLQAQVDTLEAAISPYSGTATRVSDCYSLVEYHRSVYAVLSLSTPELFERIADAVARLLARRNTEIDTATLDLAVRAEHEAWVVNSMVSLLAAQPSGLAFERLVYVAKEVVSRVRSSSLMGQEALLQGEAKALELVDTKLGLTAAQLAELFQLPLSACADATAVELLLRASIYHQSLILLGHKEIVQLLAQLHSSGECCFPIARLIEASVYIGHQCLSKEREHSCNPRLFLSTLYGCDEKLKKLPSPICRPVFVCANQMTVVLPLVHPLQIFFFTLRSNLYRSVKESALLSALSPVNSSTDLFYDRLRNLLRQLSDHPEWFLYVTIQLYQLSFFKYVVTSASTCSGNRAEDFFELFGNDRDTSETRWLPKKLAKSVVAFSIELKEMLAQSALELLNAVQRRMLVTNGLALQLFDPGQILGELDSIYPLPIKEAVLQNELVPFVSLQPDTVQQLILDELVHLSGQTLNNYLDIVYLLGKLFYLIKSLTITPVNRDWDFGLQERIMLAQNGFSNAPLKSELINCASLTFATALHVKRLVSLLRAAYSICFSVTTLLYLLRSASQNKSSKTFLTADAVTAHPLSRFRNVERNDEPQDSFNMFTVILLRGGSSSDRSIRVPEFELYLNDVIGYIHLFYGQWKCSWKVTENVIADALERVGSASNFNDLKNLFTITPLDIIQALVAHQAWEHLYNFTKYCSQNIMESGLLYHFQGIAYNHLMSQRGEKIDELYFAEIMDRAASRLPQTLLHSFAIYMQKFHRLEGKLFKMLQHCLHCCAQTFSNKLEDQLELGFNLCHAKAIYVAFLCDFTLEFHLMVAFEHFALEMVETLDEVQTQLQCLLGEEAAGMADFIAIEHLWEFFFSYLCDNHSYVIAMRIFVLEYCSHRTTQDGMVLTFVKSAIVGIENQVIDVDEVISAIRLLADHVVLLNNVLTRLIQLNFLMTPERVRGKILTQIIQNTLIQILQDPTQAALHQLLLAFYIQARLPRNDLDTLIRHLTALGCLRSYEAHSQYDDVLPDLILKSLRFFHDDRKDWVYGHFSQPNDRFVLDFLNTSGTLLDDVENDPMLDEMWLVHADLYQNCQTYVQTAQNRTESFIVVPSSYFDVVSLSADAILCSSVVFNKNQLLYLETSALLKTELLQLWRSKVGSIYLRSIFHVKPQHLAIALSASGLLDKALWCCSSWKMNPEPSFRAYLQGVLCAFDHTEVSSVGAYKDLDTTDIVPPLFWFSSVTTKKRLSEPPLDSPFSSKLHTPWITFMKGIDQFYSTDGDTSSARLLAHRIFDFLLKRFSNATAPPLSSKMIQYMCEHPVHETAGLVPFLLSLVYTSHSVAFSAPDVASKFLAYWVKRPSNSWGTFLIVPSHDIELIKRWLFSQKCSEAKSMFQEYLDQISRK